LNTQTINFKNNNISNNNILENDIVLDKSYNDNFEYIKLRIKDEYKYAYKDNLPNQDKEVD
jgi:hypothetical protein